MTVLAVVVTTEPAAPVTGAGVVRVPTGGAEAVAGGRVLATVAVIGATTVFVTGAGVVAGGGVDAAGAGAGEVAGASVLAALDTTGVT